MPKVASNDSLVFFSSVLFNTLTFKTPKQKLQQTALYFFYFYLSKEIRVEISSLIFSEKQ